MMVVKVMCSCRYLRGPGPDTELPGSFWTLVLQHQRDERCRAAESEQDLL